jgi:hypothetical protein
VVAEVLALFIAVLLAAIFGFDQSMLVGVLVVSHIVAFSAVWSYLDRKKNK